MEAKVAMDIAQVDGTLEFTLGTSANITTGNRRFKVDLNETPFRIKEEHLSRMRALSKTVELGRRFFPRCSRVLDKIMDDESTDLACLGNETSEQLLQQQRYQELQVVVQKAFCEDKEENKSAISTSPSLEPTQKLNMR